MIKLPKNNNKVCGMKLYNTEARCNVVASNWTRAGTLLCIRIDGIIETKTRVCTYEATEDILEFGWK